MAKNEEILAFALEIDPKRAQKALRDLNRDLVGLTKVPQRFEKAEKRAFEDMRKGILESRKQMRGLTQSLKDAEKFTKKGFVGVSGSQAKATSKQLGMVRGEINKVRDAQKNLTKLMSSHEREISQLTKESKKGATKESREAAKKQLQEAKRVASEELKLARKRVTGLQKGLQKKMDKEGVGKNLRSLKRQQEEYKEGMANLRRSFLDAGKTGGVEAAQEFAAGLNSLSSRDLGGMISNLGKALGKGAKGTAGGMLAWAEKRQESGAMGGAGGGMAKAILGMSRTMGPMIKTLAEMGPILSATASVILGIVKLFMDVESFGKQFNKDLLQTASTSEFLARNAGQADAAYHDMRDTLDNIREAAMDVDENMQWGISKDEHKAFFNTLTAEGVALSEVSKQFKVSGQAAADSVKMVTSYGDAVHVAVGYSRLFGVSLQEITSFQAEMMTEMGSSMEDVTKSFATIAGGAADSGIATNKFFSMVRAVSSDLALYNTRLEDTVHTLSLLGKTMSPKNAQKFLQQTVEGFKNMGRTERLKMTLLTGQQKTSEIVERDLNRKRKDVAQRLAQFTGGDAGQILETIKKGGPEATALVQSQGVPENERGALREAILQLRVDAQRSKRGLFGVSGATRNLSTGGVYEMMKSATMSMSGGKYSTLGAAAGNINMEMMAESLGYNQETVDQMIKFEAALEDQRALVKKSLANDVERAKLEEKLGMKSIDADKLTTDQLLDTMSEGDKDALKNAKTQLDFAQEQSKLQQDMSQKLEVIIDGIFNFLYVQLKSVVADLDEFFDLISKSKWFSGMVSPEKQAKHDAREILRSGRNQSNTAFMNQMENALAGSGRTGMIQVMGDQVTARIDKSMKDASKAPGFASMSGGEQLGKSGYDLLKVLTSVGGAGGGTMQKDQLKSIMGMTGGLISADKQAAFNAALDKGGNFGSAAKAANLSAADYKAFAQKSMWSMSESDMARVAAVMKVDPSIAGSSPVPAATRSAAPASMASALAPSGHAAVTVKAPTAEGQAATVNSVESVHQALTQQGITIDKSFLEGPYQRMLKEAFYDANSKVMLEYFLYSSMSRSSVMQSLSAGVGPAQFGAKNLADLQRASMPHATGGIVARPAPGEVFASVAPGERILPKGASGGINITVNGGAETQALANVIKRKVEEGITEHERLKAMRLR